MVELAIARSQLQRFQDAIIITGTLATFDHMLRSAVMS